MVLGSFAVQFGDHLRSGIICGLGIICGAVQTSQNWLISTRQKSDFEGSGYRQHLPQNLGCTEDYEQTKRIFISPLSILSRTESLKEIENLIKIEWSIRGQPLTVDPRHA